MSGTDLASDFSLDTDLTRVLALASWIGHLQRERRGSASSVPPGHWRDVLAACLIADDRSSRWVQAAAADLLRRPSLLPDPSLAWQARRGASAGLAPASSDGHFTRSVRDGLLPGAAKVRLDRNTPVGMVHLLATMVLGTAPEHEKDLHELSPPDGEGFRRFVAIWLVEFQDRLSAQVPEQRVADWFDGASRYERLGMSEPQDAWCPTFTGEVALRHGGGAYGPWLEAIFVAAPHSAEPDESARLFLANEQRVLRRCLITGDVINNTSKAGTRGGAVVVERARILATRTSPDQRPGLRHLLGALLAADASLPPLPADPPGEDAELRNLRRRCAAIELPGADLRSAWADAILGERLSRVPLVLDSGTEDRLGFRRYARALTSVIADRSVQPPLSIGLFGAWGSGKSFLIERIRDELLDIAGRTDATQGGFCRGVVPVDFNAWHYAETNLWASLFVRILQVLGQHLSDQPVPTNAQTRGQVLARLGQLHTELGTLETQAVIQRKTLEEARATVGASTALLDVVRRWLKIQPPTDMKLSAALKEADEAVKNVRDEREALRNTWTALSGLVRRFGQLSGRGLLTAVLPSALIILAVVASLWWYSDKLGPAISWGAGVISAVVAAIVSVVGWLRQYREWLDGELSTIDAVRRDAEEKAAPQVAAALKETMARAEALRTEITTLHARAEALEPRRQLADFVASRAGSKDYAELLGTPALIRHDIEQLTAFLGSSDASAKVERIVLIVDDLDRCPPDAVVHVLEAVHILLASPLFVVIVGVDPRWLCGALQTRFEGLLGTDASAELAAPWEFLEKIFQIPFRVPGMSSGGRRALAAAALPPPWIAGEPSRRTEAPVAGQGSGGKRQNEEGMNRPLLPSHSLSPPLPTVHPVALEAEEHELLLALSEVAGDTPRRLKRFLRCYMILRASIDRDRLADWREACLYEPPARLLAAIAAAPAAWPAVHNALRNAADADPATNVVGRCTALTTECAAALNTVFGKAISAGELRPWLDEADRFTFPV